MKFLDEAKIFVSSGHGGAGCIAFRREKFIEHGGPNGGDGGDGGNVYFEVVDNLNTLIDFRYRQHFKAPAGEGGKGKNRYGSKGESIVIRVPVGTQILAEDKQTVLYDFVQTGERVLFLKGGMGGMGNAQFKTSVNQAPRKAQPGLPGQEIWVWLRLKLIADVGVIGFPNAGKSTFLSVVTHAKPKIADYPFTTLVPNLGVAQVDDHEFVIADVPGLIEGAHLGLGLGHRFLGHVERCAVLLHLVDGTSEDVARSYEIIREELASYQPALAHRAEVVALSKQDLLDAEELAEKQAALRKVVPKETPILCLSSVTHQGVKDVMRLLYRSVVEHRQLGTSDDDQTR